MGSHSVICHPTEVTARFHPNRGRGGWYSIYRPRKGERLSWPSWLVTYRNGLPVHMQTVTHPGTNRVWRSAITLIEANALPLRQTANHTENTWTRRWTDRRRLHHGMQGHSVTWRKPCEMTENDVSAGFDFGLLSPWPVTCWTPWATVHALAPGKIYFSLNRNRFIRFRSITFTSW